MKISVALAATAAVVALAPDAAASTGSPGSPGSPAGPPAGLRAALHDMVTAGDPGVVAYARRGDRQWRLASGVADRATGAPARPDDRVRVFSNTKSFVSVVLLQLVGEGPLRLDDPVDRWLPGVVRGHGNDGSAVTVRQLLNNTSGIYDPTNDPSFGTDRGGHTPREVVAAAMAHPPLFPAGTAWDYSNTNYILAGMVIQAVTHRGPDVEIRRRILAPLKLAHTSFPLDDPTIPGRHLHGYDLRYRDVTGFNPSGEWTAGAMISTVADLARYDRALFGGRLLRPAQQRDLETTVPTDSPGIGYGLGVEQLPVPCPSGATTVWETDGGGPGYTSVSVTSADTARQLVLAANVFDLGRDQRHENPVPDSGDAFPRALTSVLC
jgi:D-alanyl-D-alanine carboxypeptidase